MVLSHRQKTIIISLLVYWPAVFILTHIPVPQLVRQADVSDRSLHFLAYLILTFLLWLAFNPEKQVKWRQIRTWYAFLVIAGYGAIDELLQNFVAGRSCDVIDFCYNLAGALIGLILLSILSFHPATLVVTGIAIFTLTNIAKANLDELAPTANALFHFFGYGFFTMLWVQYIRLFLKIRAAEPKWLIMALGLPIGFLLAVKLSSAILGRDFRPADVILAVGGIATVVAAIYLTALFRRRFVPPPCPAPGRRKG